MSEVAAIESEVVSLRRQNKQLAQRLEETVQALEAFARGEVDTVARASFANPVLLAAAQSELRRSADLLRAVFNGSVDALLLADDEGRCVDANPAACTLFGLGHEDLLGRSLVELAVTAHDAEATHDEVNKHAHGRGEFPIQRPDGSRRILDHRAVADVVSGLHLHIMTDVTERVASEQELRASRTMLEEAQAIAHAGSWRSGLMPDGTIEWSREATRILGVPYGASMAVASFLEMIHPDDREQFRRATHAAITHGTPAEVEHRIVRPDGGVHWVQQRGVIERDSEGAAIGLFGTILDVTDRHVAIQALQRSETEFRLLAESMPQIVWITDPDGGWIYVNRLWTDYTGLTLEESLGDGWNGPFHPDDKQRAWEAWQHATSTIGTYSLECRIRRADGVYRWWLIRGVPVRDDGNNILRKWFGTYTDVDALKQGEARLRESEAMHRLAGRAARVGGWKVDLPPRNVAWSDEVCDIHEVPSGTMPSLEEAFAAYAPEFRDTIGDRFGTCARDGTPFDLELQIITRTGRRIWVRSIGDAERDASGVITAVRGAFQDIDDKRKLQDQFRHAQKMEAVGRLAGGVAHDFNNLLSVVLSYSELAIDTLSAADPLRLDLEQIRDAGVRATKLTSQLLAFSRQQVLQPRVIDLRETVAAMKPMLGRLLGEDIEITVVSPHSVGRVLADPGQVEQVVMNLAVNARDAMLGGGALAIEIVDVYLDENHAGKPIDVAPGPFVMLAVSDNGSGMTEETRLRIFEPFFTTKQEGKGTGLGLATVFGIVRQSGGYVTVHTQLRVGTTFNVYFPRTDQVSRAFNSPSAVVLGGAETILVVEDEEQVRAAAAKILRKRGYNVLDASNGDEGILVLRRFSGKVDLLITDVVMPRLGGRRLVEEIAPQRPEMKVLFMSGYTDDAVIQHGVLDAGIAFLQKPFTPSSLLRKVREVLDGAARAAPRG